MLRSRGVRWSHAAATFAAILVVFAGTASPLVAQPAGDVNMFQRRVADYLELRETLRRGVEAEHIVDPRIRAISGALLAARIRQARSQAAVGDLVPATLADQIRSEIRRAVDETDVDMLLTSLYGDDLPADAAACNMSYPDAIAVRPPAVILSVLPPVPKELGYRLIGRDIAIWDEAAAMVLDVIADALPAPRIWDFVDLTSFELRQRVRQSLRDAGLDPKALLAEMASDTEPGARAPVIGEPFSWALGNMMLPSLLQALPDLPKPLEYRLVGADLVVINVATGRVVGILRDALPGGRKLTNHSI